MPDRRPDDRRSFGVGLSSNAEKETAP